MSNATLGLFNITPPRRSARPDVASSSSGAFRDICRWSFQIVTRWFRFPCISMSSLNHSWLLKRSAVPPAASPAAPYGGLTAALWLLWLLLCYFCPCCCCCSCCCLCCCPCCPSCCWWCRWYYYTRCKKDNTQYVGLTQTQLDSNIVLSLRLEFSLEFPCSCLDIVCSRSCCHKVSQLHSSEVTSIERELEREGLRNVNEIERVREGERERGGTEREREGERDNHGFRLRLVLSAGSDHRFSTYWLSGSGLNSDSVFICQWLGHHCSEADIRAPTHVTDNYCYYYQYNTW